MAGRPIRLFVLLGDPVGHSLSPAMQNAALRALGLEALYIPLAVTEVEVPILMRAVARSGGGGNITIPHKQRAAAALDSATEAVRATGVCNTFWWDPDTGLSGDNTDVEGFRGAAEDLLGTGLRGRRVLLLGAGGAGRAVALACVEARVAALHVWNRTAARAQALVQSLRAPEVASALDDVADAVHARYDLVVNATPLGLAPDDPLPLDLEGAPGGPRVEAVLDLVYGPDDTPWVRVARRLGLRAADGREMLVRQGAASFRRWWGVAPPLQVMRAGVGLS